MLIEIDPRAAKEATLEEFVAFVHRYGHIPNIDNIRSGVQRATMLFAELEDGAMIGVAAAKRPWPDYTQGSFEGAGSPLDASVFLDELGYIAVRCDRQHRRIGPALALAALGAMESRPVFATTRADNPKIHRLLQKPQFGFGREGEPYQSTDGKMLTLFVRQPSQTHI